MWPFRKKQPPKQAYEAALRKLIDLGYLKYVPEDERETVQQQLLASLQRGILESDWDEDLVTSDRRGYPADNEELAEGRIGESLKLMRDVLAKEGVRPDSVEDDFAEDRYDLVINGERFRVYDTPAETPHDQSWAISAKRLLEIVNELLQRAGSSERLFGIYGGNDGRVMLLTLDMYEYLKQLEFIAPRWMPYKSETIETGE